MSFIKITANESLLDSFTKVKKPSSIYHKLQSLGTVLNSQDIPLLSHQNDLLDLKVTESIYPQLPQLDPSALEKVYEDQDVIIYLKRK